MASGSVDRGLFRPGIPRALNNTLIAPPPFSTLGQFADLHPDGERFAVLPAGAGPGAGAAADEGSATVVLVLDFFEELRRRSGR